MYDSSYLSSVAVGDYVTLDATVAEYYGMTELTYVTSLTVGSSGNTLTPASVSTGTLGIDCSTSGEPYEGVLVTITGASATGDADSYGQIPIDDGSGETQLEDSLYDYHSAEAEGLEVTVGTVFDQLSGVVKFAYESYELHPLDADHVVHEGAGGAQMST